jgi:trehalose-6-phosphatase
VQTLHQWSYQWAEEFLDVNDSIRRREKADLIYRDYVDCRISRQRAVVELRILNKRQKGGWLKGDSKKIRNKLRLKNQ